MPNEYRHTGIDPKVQGTWNVHNAIKGKDSELDFFLMSSSISGSVGTATESNYCAANYFLNVFARYRWSLGLPATLVGLGMISEVGYLHDNPVPCQILPCDSLPYLLPSHVSLLISITYLLPITD